jgi:hypothetical protein
LEHWKREIEAWTDMYAVVYQGTQKDREVIEYYEWYKWDRVQHYYYFFFFLNL